MRVTMPKPPYVNSPAEYGPMPHLNKRASSSPPASRRALRYKLPSGSQKVGQHALRYPRLQGDHAQFCVEINDLLEGRKIKDDAAVARWQGGLSISHS